MWGLPIAFCLVLVSAVTVIDASICTTCPENSCSQNEAHNGFCNDESYVTRQYGCSYVSSTRRSQITYYRCGWFNWRRCNSRVYYYITLRRYQTCYQRKLVCKQRCCFGFQPYNGSCVASCGHPTSISNGVRTYSGTTEGHTVHYTCNPGYTINGHSGRVCQSDGLWSGSQPSCEMISCAKITKPQNGHVNIESTQHHGIARYECNPGYVVAGQSVRKCQENGQWSGIPPQCIDLDECETGLHSCNPNTSVCLNTHGSYVCHCLPGFEDSVNSKNEIICRDIDECKTTQAGNCEHRCGNTLGSYQCHCNEGYSLEGDECKRDTSPCAEEQFPVPNHSSVTCYNVLEHGIDLLCMLRCDPMFTFEDPEDNSVRCHNGIWDFQQMGKEIPDCQPIKKRVAVITGQVESNETCLARQKYRQINGADAPIHPSIDFECERMRSRSKRSAAEVGRLFATFTFSEEIPFDCDYDCLDRISWVIRFQFYEARWRVYNGFTLSVTNLETSEQVNVTLKGELEADDDEPQITCTSGRVLSQDQDVCVPCAPGAFFNTSGPAATCDPCPLHHYQNESEQTECKACPTGTFTIARGSNELEDCRAPCSPGTASENGLAPCEECKKGFYQPESGANFCYKCHLGQITHSTGSTRKEDCGCPAGRYWNDCLEKCPCANGGICELDGSCICPKGLSGPYCTKSDPYHACQDYYLFSFWKKVDNPPMRHIFALTGVKNGSVSVTVKFNDSTPQVSEYHISSGDDLNLQFSPKTTVVQISANSEIRMFGETEGEESGDAFAALPISPLLGETKFEEYLVLSHANKRLQANFKTVVLVVVSTDNTQVRVTPAHNASAVGGLSLEKDKEVEIVRHRLDVLTVTSSNDLSGTVIRTNKPIAVYSAHECGNIPVFVSGCSHHIVQMPPVRVLGDCYIATSFMGRQDDSYVKFVVAKDGTDVEAYENDDVVATYGPLDQGTFHEQYLGPGRVLVLKSNHPIMVAQFSSAAQFDEVGAPFMIVLPSLSQLVSEVPFYSKNSSSMNYITITLPSQYYDEDALILDGDPIYSNATSTVQSPLCGNFTTISLEVDPGRHYLQHTTPGAGFLLSVYGFGPGTSYGYSPGLHQVLSCDDSSGNVEAAQK